MTVGDTLKGVCTLSFVWLAVSTIAEHSLVNLIIIRESSVSSVSSTLDSTIT